MFKLHCEMISFFAYMPSEDSYESTQSIAPEKMLFFFFPLKSTNVFSYFSTKAYVVHTH